MYVHTHADYSRSGDDSGKTYEYLTRAAFELIASDHGNLDEGITLIQAGTTRKNQNNKDFNHFHCLTLSLSLSLSLPLFLTFFLSSFFISYSHTCTQTSHLLLSPFLAIFFSLYILLSFPLPLPQVQPPSLTLMFSSHFTSLLAAGNVGSATDASALLGVVTKGLQRLRAEVRSEKIR